MNKASLYLGCALTALAAAPAAAQTGATPTQQATTATPADASTAASPTNADAQATAADGQQTDASGRRRARVEERDVVVTGSRFQKLLDQPQSKSIINAEDRNLAGVGDTRQLIQVQPGFNYSDSFGLNVRGVGRQTDQTLLGQENTVIQYVDGFINLVPSNIAESTLFGGNIQFIRGPSGTTGGRNSLAGSVNLLSRAPTPTFTAEAEAGYSRNGGSDVGANVAGPITGNLGFRVGFQEFIRPTIFTNLSGRTLDSKHPGFAENNRYIEFQLEWRPGPFHIRNRLTTFEYDNQPGYPTVGRYNSNLPSGNPAAIFGGLDPNPQYGYAGPTPTNPYEINVNYAGYNRLRHNLQDIVNADLDLGFASLVYTGGYQRYLATGSADIDLTSRTSYDAGTTAPFTFAPGTQVPTDYRNAYDNNNNFQSHEVKLESKPNGGPFAWVLGVYHYNQRFNEHFYEFIANPTPVLATPQITSTNPAPGAPNPLNATFEQRNIYDIRSNAVFGNVTLDIGEHVRFDGGLRYTADEKEAVTNFRYIFYYPPFYAADVSPAVHGATPFKRDKGLSGRASLAYRFTPGNEIYASYQRGYQASAFTLGQGLPPNNIAGKENLDVYEIGGFTTAGRIRFDGSVFYQNFFEQQIPISTRNQLTTTNPMTGVTTTAPGPIFTTFVNAPLSRIYGAEAQLTYRPNDHSNIVASYTYLHPTFERFSGPVDISEPCAPQANGTTNVTATGTCLVNPLFGVTQNLAGRDIPRTPRNKATLYGYYGIPLGSLGYLYPGGNVSYQSSQYANAFNSPRFRIPSRTIAGLTLTYRTPGEHLDITGSVSNVFRNRYPDALAITAFANGTTNTVTTYGADRYYTITGRYRF